MRDVRGEVAEQRKQLKELMDAGRFLFLQRVQLSHPLAVLACLRKPLQEPFLP